MGFLDKRLRVNFADVAPNDQVGGSAELIYGGNGKRRVISRTFSRTRPSAASSLRFANASATRSAISSISSSFMPRVVTAGVPIRIPPCLEIGVVSKGIGFLFTGMQ